MQLKTVIEPFKSASYGNALSLCRKLIPECEYHVHPDGTVDVHGDMFPASLSSFVVNQKLAVRFGNLTGSVETLKLAASIRTLEGLPKKLPDRILDVRSDFLKDLTGSPEEIDFFYVNSQSITSLKGAPKRVNSTFSVIATVLTSFDGLPSVVGSLDLSLCRKVKTTDGIGESNIVDLILPSSIEQVTDIPKTCTTITMVPCAGIAHLLRVPDLEHVDFLNNSSNSNSRSSNILRVALKQIFDECLALNTSPRARWLHAERLLIDRDLEYLL